MTIALIVFFCILIISFITGVILTSKESKRVSIREEIVEPSANIEEDLENNSVINTVWSYSQPIRKVDDDQSSTSVIEEVIEPVVISNDEQSVEESYVLSDVEEDIEQIRPSFEEEEIIGDESDENEVEQLYDFSDIDKIVQQINNSSDVGNNNEQEYINSDVEDRI